jgi:intraflagellar transport protein 122
MPPAEANQTN